MNSRTDRINFVFIPVLILVISLFIIQVPAYTESDPTILQKRAIERIERFMNNFRTTGDRVSLLGELQLAEDELAATHSAFMRAGDLGSAALSLIKSGDIQRMQNRWHQAIDLYQQAYGLAIKADHPAYQAKALMGRARAELYGLRDLGAAAAYIEKALGLSAMLEDKTYFFDALDYKAQIQVNG